MRDRCDVLIWGKKIGELSYSLNWGLYFVYTTKPPFEISPLQLSTKQKEFKYLLSREQRGLAGVFSDSLPDWYGHKVLENYFDSLNVEGNIIDRLLLIGDRTMGAITYKPTAPNINSKYQTMSLQELYIESKKLKDADYYKDLSLSINLIKSSASVGGARDKALIGFKDLDSDIILSQKDIKLPKGYKECIVKFNKDENKDDLIIEYIYMSIAKEVGIDTPKTYLSNEGHFIIERFDRTDKGKMHMHSLHGYLYDDSVPFGSTSYTKAFVALQNLQVPQEDLEQMYRRMVFNYLFVNQDDHEKNHSFLMDRQGNWRLSPAYDLTYNPIFSNAKIDKCAIYDNYKAIAKKFKIKNFKEIIKEIKSLREDVLFKKLKEHNVSKEKIKKMQAVMKEYDIKISAHEK